MERIYKVNYKVRFTIFGGSPFGDKTVEDEAIPPPDELLPF